MQKQNERDSDVETQRQPPQAADLLRLIDGLSPERRALLALNLKKKRAQSAKKRIPPRIKENGPPPLSFAQQRLWFLDQLEPHSALYNIFAAVNLKGSLNLPALHRTFNEIT